MGVLCTEMNDRKKKIEEKEKNVKKKTELSSKFEKNLQILNHLKIIRM